ncbi:MULTISPECIES: copper resistance protein CopC [Streptomyces]|uniref:Protein YobA n=1 Tax=Streptomyces sviceus (strain ATCC 29083 / DSM 924 / JCM 4929 / NBRC 13980 / NCIMB 11184 / NRRL 5439 / UC 5370) TaxID=463191 RepID=B5HU62_STRX2|nr:MULTISPECIES: copper resistance protein CopC [Streptomyces]EDY56367.1 transport integral membrane protein [Streptomyces sviceus ATCC 29083]MYT06866.1 transporter [Streptomyces sp. SID5470]
MLLGSVLVLLLFGGAGAASAHAALRATDPEDGTVLKSAPRDITLTFTESVGLLDDSFRVLDPDGKRLKTGDAGHGAGGSETARVSLPAKLAQGTYTVAWRVVSADSHPVSGAFTFSVGKPSPAIVVADTGPTENPATESLFNMGRYLAYLAAALLIGTAVFVAACRPPDPSRLRRLLWAGWGTLLGSTVFLLVLRAPYESGAGPASAFSLRAFERTLTTRPGEALLVRLALLLVAYFFVVRLLRLGEERLPRVWQAAGGALAVGLALTWAAAEHASAGIQVPVAMTSAVLHVLAMSVWLGGLAALLTTLYRASAQLPAVVLARFSRLAFASVTVLVGTGVYQSWRGLGSWGAVTGTTYGHLLVLKLLAVTLLLAAARLSRQWTGRLVRVAAEGESEVVVREKVPAAVAAEGESQAAVRGKVPAAVAAEGESQAVVREKVPERVGGPPSAPEPAPATPGPTAAPAYRHGLRRSVLAEVAVGVVVLVLSTVLSGTLPGRAQAEAAEAGPATGGLPAASVTDVPFAVGGATGKVQITLDPGRTGDNSVQAIVYAADGGLATVPELRLSFTLPAKEIGPIDAGLKNRGGYWGTNDLTLPLAGDWRMKATIRVSDVDQISVTKTVRIVG